MTPETFNCGKCQYPGWSEDELKFGLCPYCYAEYVKELKAAVMEKFYKKHRKCRNWHGDLEWENLFNG